jgi:hypothetical protein
VGFGRPALGHGLPLQAPALPGGGVALEGLDEALELVLDALLHRLGAGGELGQHVVGDALHFGDAMDRLGPLHSQGAGQLGPQAGVVEGGQAPLIQLDGAGVKGQPAAVVGHDPVGDDHVGVQLGVERPAGLLAEAGGGDALGVEGAHLAADAVAGVGVLLDPVDHGRHRRVVGVEDGGASGVVSQGEEHRH